MTTPWIHCCCIPPRSTKTRDEGQDGGVTGPSVSKCQQKEVRKSTKGSRNEMMNSRAVLLPTASLVPACSMLSDSLHEMPYSTPQCKGVLSSLPRPTSYLDSVPPGSRTHNKFPYETAGVYRGTPAARHHTLSFFLQGELEVQGSIWH